MLIELASVFGVSALKAEKGKRLLGEGGRYLSGCSSDVSSGEDGRPFVRRKLKARRKSAVQAETMEVRKRRMKISMPTSCLVCQQMLILQNSWREGDRILPKLESET